MTTARNEAIEYLSDGMSLLKKHGLYGRDEEAHCFAMDRALSNLAGTDGAPEIAAALQALFEAKRLITARASIAGKRIVMGDWFMSLAVSLALSRANRAVTGIISGEFNRVGENVNKLMFSASKGEYLKTVDEACRVYRENKNAKGEDAEQSGDALSFIPSPSLHTPDEKKTDIPAYERLLSHLEKSCYKETAPYARQALARMENVFAAMFNGENACERDSFIYGALMSGGKRLRPLLVSLCAGFGNTEKCDDDIISIMVIIELMHSASLVHDDIVDRSPLRRSRATINAQKGDGYAAMCGFSMVAASLDLMSRLSDSGIPALIANIPRRMCEGEFLQFEIENRPDMQSEPEYFERIERKTAALIEGSCVCGAMASGAPDSVVKALSVYGNALGILFQLRDDLMDCDIEPTDGKPISQDIERGIYSLPLLYAKEAAPDDANMHAIMRKHIKSPEDIAYLLDACRKYGGIEYTKSVISLKADEARTALATLPANARTEALSLLLTYLAGPAAGSQKIVRMINER